MKHLNLHAPIHGSCTSTKRSNAKKCNPPRVPVSEPPSFSRTPNKIPISRNQFRRVSQTTVHSNTQFTAINTPLHLTYPLVLEARANVRKLLVNTPALLLLILTIAHIANEHRQPSHPRERHRRSQKSPLTAPSLRRRNRTPWSSPCLLPPLPGAPLLLHIGTRRARKKLENPWSLPPAGDAKQMEQRTNRRIDTEAGVVEAHRKVWHGREGLVFEHCFGGSEHFKGPLHTTRASLLLPSPVHLRGCRLRPSCHSAGEWPVGAAAARNWLARAESFNLFRLHRPIRTTTWRRFRTKFPVPASASLLEFWAGRLCHRKKNSDENSFCIFLLGLNPPKHVRGHTSGSIFGPKLKISIFIFFRHIDSDYPRLIYFQIKITTVNFFMWTRTKNVQCNPTVKKLLLGENDGVFTINSFLFFHQVV